MKQYFCFVEAVQIRFYLQLSVHNKHVVGQAVSVSVSRYKCEHAVKETRLNIIHFDLINLQ